MSNIALIKETRGLENDRLMTQRILESQKNVMAEALKGEMGKDIDNVLSGKVKVKLTTKEKVKYNLKYWINKIFNTF